MFSAKGRFRGTIYFNADGSFARFVGHPSFRKTLSSEWASITTDDRGVDKFTLNPDGMLSVFGTGIHQRVKGEEYAIGLWRLVIDLETGELLGASYHRNLGLEQPATSTLTSLRASGAAPGQLTHSEACSDTAPCVDERASPAWLTRLRIGRLPAVRGTSRLTLAPPGDAAAYRPRCGTARGRPVQAFASDRVGRTHSAGWEGALRLGDSASADRHAPPCVSCGESACRDAMRAWTSGDVRV
jgi:hypothetical protein